MKDDSKRTEAKTIASNNMQYNLIKQRVKMNKESDSFWIDASAMLPALQDAESQRAFGSSIKPIAYSKEYAQFLLDELLNNQGVEQTCKRLLTKCYMIEFNHVANSLVKKYYEQLRTAKPNVPVNKFDVEKLVNESQEMQFFNKNHYFEKSAVADPIAREVSKEMKKMQLADAEAGKPEWSDERKEKVKAELYKYIQDEIRKHIAFVNNL